MVQHTGSDSTGELLSELRRTPSRLALVVGDPSGHVAGALAERFCMTITHADICLLEPKPVMSHQEVVDRLAAVGGLITDLDIVFWRPWLRLDPLGVMRAVTRRRPGAIFWWPGNVHGGRATYSEPGRRDHYEASLNDAIVLHPMPIQFPDDPPYRLERYA